jgi:hypothetical protein
MHNVQSPRSDDDAIEQEILRKGLTAPRVTPADIEANIAAEHYFTVGAALRALGHPTDDAFDLTTVVALKTRNGFTVYGKSACASPENFNAELGVKIARQDAVNQLWPLMGYALREKLANDDPRAKLDSIARVAHEVNRSYCQALGDNSQPAWEDAPAWQRESARMGVDLHVSGDFGPEASHISWMKQKVEDGWVYGPQKDPEAKTHPCIVPFDQLAPEQQAKDHLFRGVVHALR